jgi:hypothetical protein
VAVHAGWPPLQAETRPPGRIRRSPAVAPPDPRKPAANITARPPRGSPTRPDPRRQPRTLPAARHGVEEPTALVAYGASLLCRYSCGLPLAWDCLGNRGSRRAGPHRCLSASETAVTTSRICSAGPHRCFKERETAVTASRARSAATGMHRKADTARAAPHNSLVALPGQSPDCLRRCLARPRLDCGVAGLGLFTALPGCGLLAVLSARPRRVWRCPVRAGPGSA